VPKLNIPERYQSGVALIRQLDDNSVQEIRNALDRTLDIKTSDQDVASGRKLDELAVTAVTSVSSKSNLNFKRIAEALVVLYGAKSVKDISVEEFADRVCEAMEHLDSPDLKLPSAEREPFKRKLIILLGANVFGIASKIVDLRTDDERVFCQARILTDLRPVFGSRIEEGPQGMVVVHLLKLGFHSASEKHQEFFVSLDSDDLQTLRNLIDRAEAKARSLKGSLGGIRLFGVAKE
jgi:hypothetical protein